MSWAGIFDTIFFAFGEPILQEFPIFYLRHNFYCIAYFINFSGNVFLLGLVDHLTHVCLRDPSHFFITAVHVRLDFLHQDFQLVAFGLPECLETLLFGAFILLLFMFGLQVVSLMVFEVYFALFNLILFLFDLFALLRDALSSVVNHALSLVQLVHSLVLFLEFILDAQCFTFLIHQN